MKQLMMFYDMKQRWKIVRDIRMSSARKRKEQGLEPLRTPRQWTTTYNNKSETTYNNNDKANNETTSAHFGDCLVWSWFSFCCLRHFPTQECELNA